MPEDEITPEPIMKTISGAWLAQILYVAVDLEIFTKISEGKNSVEEISTELNIDKRPAEMLLNACVASDFLVKEGSEYKNSEVSDKFLVKDKPAYQGELVMMLGGDELKRWGDLKKSILTNSPNTPGLSERVKDLEKATRFTKAMHGNSIGSAMILADKFDFSKFRKILDLGGGSGAYPIALAKKYPNMTGTVFDFENVCSVAKEFIKEYDVESKVGTVVGDFLKDEFPKDHDVVLLSQIFHSLGVESSKAVIKKSYAYLLDNGIIIVNEFLLNEDKTGPIVPALFALNMLLATENGNVYTETEVRGWLEEAGFKHLETMQLAGPTSSIIARK